MNWKTLNLVGAERQVRGKKEIISRRFPPSSRVHNRETHASKSKVYKPSVTSPVIKRHLAILAAVWCELFINTLGEVRSEIITAPLFF